MTSAPFLEEHPAIRPPAPAASPPLIQGPEQGQRGTASAKNSGCVLQPSPSRAITEDHVRRQVFTDMFISGWNEVSTKAELKKRLTWYFP